MRVFPAHIFGVMPSGSRTATRHTTLRHIGVVQYGVASFVLKSIPCLIFLNLIVYHKNIYHLICDKEGYIHFWLNVTPFS